MCSLSSSSEIDKQIERSQIDWLAMSLLRILKTLQGSNLLIILIVLVYLADCDSTKTTASTTHLKRVQLSSASDQPTNEEDDQFANSAKRMRLEEEANALDSIIEQFQLKVKDTVSDQMSQLVAEAPLAPQEVDKFEDASEVFMEDIELPVAEVAKKLAESKQLPVSISPPTRLKSEPQARWLYTAGAFIGKKVGAIKSNLSNRIPAKLRNLMKWPTFLDFKIRFNKVYKSLGEELYRQMIFLYTQTYVAAQHLKYLFGKESHITSATEFSDWTLDEYQETFNNKLAERADDPPSEAEDLQEFDRNRLAKLADMRRNIFGQDMGKFMYKSFKKSKKIHQLHRKKRSTINRSASVDVMDIDGDDDADGLDGVKNELMDEDGDDETQVVDAYAADLDPNADLSMLDNIEDIVDEALSETGVFEPIDLRETGCLIKPENQDRCGACYAYVTAAAASYYNCMGSPTKQSDRLNPRFTSDCGRFLTSDGIRAGVNGCAGGRVSQAINFTKIAGAHSFMDYELARQFADYNSDTCAYQRPESIENWGAIEVPFYKKTRFVNLKMDEVDLHLRAVGPVFVNMRTWRDFPYQRSGIYGKIEKVESPIIHSMLIVGHNKDVQGRDYWIIWNTHGVAWGERGFIRIYHESLEYYKVYLGGLMGFAS